MAMASHKTLSVFPLESYKIGQKEERPDKDATIAARFARMYVLMVFVDVGVGCIPARL